MAPSVLAAEITYKHKEAQSETASQRFRGHAHSSEQSSLDWQGLRRMTFVFSNVSSLRNWLSATKPEFQNSTQAQHHHTKQQAFNICTLGDKLHPTTAVAHCVLVRLPPRARVGGSSHQDGSSNYWQTMPGWKARPSTAFLYTSKYALFNSNFICCSK